MVRCAQIFRSAVLLLLIIAVSACGRSSTELRLIEPRLDFDQKIAANFAELLDTQSSVNVVLVKSRDINESALDALLADRADIALVSNNQSFHPAINAVIPLYENVLHIAYNSEAPAANITELLQDAEVYAGPPGSPSRVMLASVSKGRLQVDRINYVEIDANPCPDVIIIYAPVAPGLIQTYPLCAPYRLFSLLPDPGDIGKGSLIDAATLLSPHLKPFIIPAGTYPVIDPAAGPVVTFAVDKLLVARSDVPAPVIYDLVSEILRLRPALAAQQPGLFHDIDEKFDVSDSTYIIHPGAQAFLQRESPTIYERYSGVAEVLVTIFIGLLSGAFAIVRIYNIRRKNRIDVFYKDAIALRNSVDASSTPYARKAAIAKLRELQTAAFDLLVKEKVAADESFRIFITLSNDIIDDLRRDSD